MASSSRPQNNADNLSLYTVCSIPNSDETADNLSGAGRIIGKGYTFAGRGLERWLNSTAERLGFGPKAVAVRIQRRRKAITTYPDLPLLPGPFRAETKKIEEDCRRLIGYIRSNVASTKEQALDQIIDLSIDDSYVRGLFNVLGAVNAIEPLQSDPSVWIYYGSSLQNSSRKALVSLSDVEMNMVLRALDDRMSAFERKELEWEDSVMNDILRNLFANMYDPDRSFIAVRYYRRLMEKSHIFVYFDIAVEKAVDLIRTPPNDFEWEEGDRLLACLLEWILMYNSGPGAEFPGDMYCLDIIHRLLAVVEITLRHADKLPQTVNSRFFRMWLSHFDGGNVADNFLNAHCCMYLLIQNVAQNMNADGSWKTKRVGDVNPDNLHSNASYLQATYPHIHSQFLLRRAMCPPDLFMCEIECKRRPYSWSIPVVLQPTELETPCLGIARYVDSSNDAVLRERARRCASVLLYTDVYCRAAMMRAFASTGFMATLDFAEMVRETRRLRGSQPYNRRMNREFKRCCDANGNLLHIFRDRECCNLGRACAGKRKYSLEMNWGDMLRLHVPVGTAFSSAGHYPLLAGYTPDGKPAYVALAIFTKTSWSYCTITEGARPEDLRVLDFTCFSEMALEPSSVYVFVLRHAPAVYAEGGRSAKTMDGGEVLDATGPFSWKPIPESEIKYDNFFLDKKMYRAYLSVTEARYKGEPDSDDEGRAMEESESDGEDWKTVEEGSIITLD